MCKSSEREVGEEREGSWSFSGIKILSNMRTLLTFYLILRLMGLKEK